MSNDLISRKSVLDYIENEISKAKSTETISYLRALSVHINEYEPTAFDVDKVVEQLEEVSNTSKTEPTDLGIVDEYKWIFFNDAIEIVKAGAIDGNSKDNSSS